MFTISKPLLFDGAMGTMLQKAGLPAGTPPEKMNLTAPEAVERIHAAYAAAGADVLTANTFGASRRKLGEDPAINGAFLDEIVMEEIEPKAGEEARFRVSIDLSDLLGGGDGSAAPSPKVSPASTAKPAASSAVDAEKQRQKEQEAAYRKAVDAMKAAVQKSIETGKETIAKQKAEVQRIAQEKSLAEQRLRQLGLFSFSEKRAVREQIAQFTRESREAEQKLEGLKREARKKAEETLEKHRPPLPPALLGGSKSARRSANGDAAEKAQKIEGVLSILPMTAKEINAALGTTRRCRSPTL